MLISCCTKTSNSITDNNDNQFKFRLKEADIDEFNTFSGTVSRKYISGIKTWTFKLTDTEQKSINDYAKSLKIQDIDVIVDKDSCDNGEIKISFPTIDHELEFKLGDGQTKTFKWGNNNCDDVTIRTIQQFADSLKSLILKKNELKDIEETDILIL